MCRSAPTLLGAWVAVSDEAVRGGRRVCRLVNRRDHTALSLTPAELHAVRRGVAGALPGALLADLREGRFLATCPPATRPGRWSSLAGMIGDLEYRFRSADRLVQWLHRRVGERVFSRRAVLVQAVLALAGVLATAYVVVGRPLPAYRVQADQVPVVLLLGLAPILVHEMCHALALTHAGRRVDTVGLGLHLGSPVCFVESVDGLLMDRRQRLVQAAAGPWAEWLFTSLVALTLALAPGLPEAGLVHRFLLVQLVCVLTNLMPFVGLDGYHLFSDALRIPDLAERSSGAVDRVVAHALARTPVTREMILLALYRVANGCAAVGLLALSALMWLALFGPSVADLLHAGPTGWLWLLGLTALLGRPALRRVWPHLAAIARAIVECLDRLRFRAQWRWRIAATTVLATSPALDGATEHDLGVLAGGLTARRAHRVVMVGGPGAAVRRGWVRADDDLYRVGQLVPSGARIVGHSRSALLALRESS